MCGGSQARFREVGAWWLVGTRDLPSKGHFLFVLLCFASLHCATLRCRCCCCFSCFSWCLPRPGHTRQVFQALQKPSRDRNTILLDYHTTTGPLLPPLRHRSLLPTPLLPHLAMKAITACCLSKRAKLCSRPLQRMQWFLQFFFLA